MDGRKVRDMAVGEARPGKSRDEVLQPYIDAFVASVRRCCDDSGIPLSIIDPRLAQEDETLAGIEAAS